MAKMTATQLTITIPDGAHPGSVLNIPLRGREAVQVRVPLGCGPGSTLVLTQQEGSDDWIEEVVAPEEPSAMSAGGLSASGRRMLPSEPLAGGGFGAGGAALPLPSEPMAGGYPSGPSAFVGLDIAGTGRPDLIVAGPDYYNTGLPEGLQLGPDGSAHLSMMSTEAVLPMEPLQLPEESDLGLMPDGPVAYTVRLDTSAGIIDIIVRPDWAPHGARRFLELATAGDLDGLAFYRAVRGCLAQFGLPARRQWPPLPDDAPTGVPFLLGAVCFAAVGKHSRKSTLFICVGDMSHCFGQSPWETPIGAVAEASLDALDRIDTCYGDIAECGGAGPDTGRINSEGGQYLHNNFPLLTYIHTARCLDWPPPPRTPPLESSASRSAQPQDVSFGQHSQPFAQVGRQTTQAAQVVQAAQAVAALFHGPDAGAAPQQQQQQQQKQLARGNSSHCSDGQCRHSL
mmetsp:Transcript_2667/g.6344  ORF Transcript_2667/g.6344 Transcript_2667/m.6344 type:complete len:455 (-) Transcript_2667:504-1868(-)